MNLMFESPCLILVLSFSLILLPLFDEWQGNAHYLLESNLMVTKPVIFGSVIAFIHLSYYKVQ